MLRKEIESIVLDEVINRNKDLLSEKELLSLVATFKRVNVPALKFLCREWGLNYEKK